MKCAWAVAAAGLLTTYGGCGGGSASPNAPTTPSPSPTAAATPAPPPTGPAAVAATCQAIGYGSPKPACGKLADTSLLPLVMTAADLLVATRRDIFNTNIEIGTGSYRVVDEKAYLAGMQETLASLGVCSQADPARGTLRVKSHNTLDETYEVLNAKGNIGWCQWQYCRTCNRYFSKKG
jgi:hypothetical protein